ncbi:DUF2079 domain-containing protein [Streptomyces sp. NPDC090045]|uniref:DUF2079 domain-containing protein n=1 Tax=Streptomyces sp. NPDC090045 TaxID=3365927 RepID=UPI00381E1559
MSLLGAFTRPQPSSAGEGRLRRMLPADRALPWALAAVFFALYTALSVRLHQRLLTTGYDLGIFEQAVRSYAHGRAPVSALKGPGFHLLGDHFSPVLASLAPVYRIFPSPITLLVAQAALLAVAVVPLSRWAYQAHGRTAALVTGIGYGASWGIASAVGFDFHEICFAVPLLAFSVTALGNERWRAAAGWALPLLLVKEDLGLTVMVIGAYIAWQGSRRLGLATALAGLAGTLLEVLVIVPAFNPDHSYSHAGSFGGIESPGGILLGLLHLPMDLITPQTKVITLVLLLAPTAFMALRSPLILLALPTLCWRFLSAYPPYWGTSYHYSAILMPVVFGAFVHSLNRWAPDGSTQDRRTLRTGLAISSAMTVLLIAGFPLSALADPVTWQTPPRAAAAHRVMDNIPDDATVAASNRLVPQLTHRCTVTLFGFPNIPLTADWIIVDVKYPMGFPMSAQAQSDALDQARLDGYRAVAQDDGFLLLHRSTPGPQAGGSGRSSVSR